jgi:plastocyanin
MAMIAIAACAPSPPRPTAPPKSAASGAKPGGSPVAKSSPAPSPTVGETRLGAFTYNDYGPRDVQGKSTQDVDAEDYAFKGTFLRGTPNQAVTLRIRNTGQRPHNFSLPSQQVDVDIPTGRERVAVQVTFPESGAVRFFCKYHTAQGMNGQLLAGNIEPQPVSDSSSTRPAS